MFDRGLRTDYNHRCERVSRPFLDLTRFGSNRDCGSRWPRGLIVRPVLVTKLLNGCEGLGQGPSRGTLMDLTKAVY